MVLAKVIAPFRNYLIAMHLFILLESLTPDKSRSPACAIPYSMPAIAFASRFFPSKLPCLWIMILCACGEPAPCIDSVL